MKKTNLFIFAVLIGLGISTHATEYSTEVMRAEALRLEAYALRLLTEISMQSDLCSSDSDEMDQTVENILKNPTCGVDLICQKDGSILVNFKDECTSIYGPNTQSGVSVEDVIKTIQKEIGEYHTITCQEHSCIWKKKEIEFLFNK